MITHPNGPRVNNIVGYVIDISRSFFDRSTTIRFRKCFSVHPVTQPVLEFHFHSLPLSLNLHDSRIHTHLTVLSTELYRYLTGSVYYLEFWFWICPFKMFLRANLFVIISLYRVFFTTFWVRENVSISLSSADLFQWWRQTKNDPPIFKPFLIDVGQNGEFTNQKWMFLFKNQRS